MICRCSRPVVVSGRKDERPARLSLVQMHRHLSCAVRESPQAILYTRRARPFSSTAKNHLLALLLECTTQGHEEGSWHENGT